MTAMNITQNISNYNSANMDRDFSDIFLINEDDTSNYSMFHASIQNQFQSERVSVDNSYSSIDMKKLQLNGTSKVPSSGPLSMESRKIGSSRYKVMEGKVDKNKTKRQLELMEEIRQQRNSISSLVKNKDKKQSPFRQKSQESLQSTTQQATQIELDDFDESTRQQIVAKIGLNNDLSRSMIMSTHRE